MLTKDDLAEIRNIVREETEIESENTRSEIQSEIKLFRIQLEDRFDKVENRLKNVEIKLRKVEKDISTAVNLFDRTDIKLQKRVEEVEKHLGIPSDN